LDRIRVSCYSGYTYAQRPVSFNWKGRDYRVEGVEKEWLAPGERWFAVRTDDNKSFQLCYNEAEDRWSITEPSKERKMNKYGVRIYPMESGKILVSQTIKRGNRYVVDTLSTEEFVFLDDTEAIVDAVRRALKGKFREEGKQC
jgi:hypothetical protein